MLALASGACFGLNIAAIRRGVLSATVLQAMTTTVLLGVPYFVIAAFVFGGYEALAGMSLPGHLWMVLAGLVHFIGGRYSDYRATQSLGAALSTPVQQFSVAVSLGLAVQFLGEEFTALKLLGLTLMLSGPAVLVARRRQGIEMARTKRFQPRYGEGMFWAAMCAICYGTSPLLITLGLGTERTIGAGVAGALISYLAAGLVVVLFLALGRLRGGLFAFDAAASRWFFLSAMLVATSQMLLYMALALAPISVIVPLQRLSVMFRVVFSGLINRDAEIFDRFIIVAIAISVVGALFISVDPNVLERLISHAGMKASAPLDGPGWIS